MAWKQSLSLVNEFSSHTSLWVLRSLSYFFRSSYRSVREAPVPWMEHLVILPSDPFSSPASFCCCARLRCHWLRYRALLAQTTPYAIACHTQSFHCVSIALMLRALLSPQPMALAVTSVILPPVTLGASRYLIEKFELN